jgi:hypothetical protein
MWKSYNRFVLKTIFIKKYTYIFFQYFFYKRDKSKLCIGDSVAILNDFFYQTGGSTIYLSRLLDNLMSSTLIEAPNFTIINSRSMHRPQTRTLKKITHDPQTCKQKTLNFVQIYSLTKILHESPSTSSWSIHGLCIQLKNIYPKVL